RIEQALAPGEDRIVGGEQREWTGAARPLEAAEHDVVRVGRLLAGEIELSRECRAQRRETLAERRQMVLAVRTIGLDGRAEPLLPGSAEILAVLGIAHSQNVGEHEPDDAEVEYRVGPVVDEAGRGAPGGAAEQRRPIRIGVLKITGDRPG